VISAFQGVEEGFEHLLRHLGSRFPVGAAAEADPKGPLSGKLFRPNVPFLAGCGVLVGPLDLHDVARAGVERYNLGVRIPDADPRVGVRFSSATPVVKGRPMLVFEDHRFQEPAVDHKAVVYAVAFSPDGSMLATGAKDGSVFLRDSTGHVS